jgi:hypothetical protein
MIGAAPTAVRIVSLRAESANDSLTIPAYKQAIVACQDLAVRNPEFNIKVISMSIGFQEQPSPEQLIELQDAASAAYNSGLDIVAAAGDEGSRTISYPAAVSPIIAVGAFGSNRLPCSFSNSGPQLALLAPGCDLQEANPISGAPSSEYAGTSQADAITAADLAALRAYDPDLDAAQAKQLLISTAQAAGGLDVTALFKAAGLENVIEAGERNEPAPTVAPVAVQPPLTSQTPLKPRLPRPRAHIRRDKRTLFVRLLNLPASCKAILRIFSRIGRRPNVALTHTATRHTIVRLRARANAVLEITYAPILPGQTRISPAETIML